MVNTFEEKLKTEDLSDNTIIAYTYAVNDFLSKHESINRKNLMLYKADQMERFKPKTVNLRIQGLNRYLDYVGRPKMRLRPLRIQQKTYLENVISKADYEFLKTKLKESHYDMWYFLVRFMGATGARISELVQFKAEHVFEGYVDMYTKGGKIRRLFVPLELRKEAVAWLERRNKRSGYLFTNAKGQQISMRTIRYRLQSFAKKWGINPKVMHPHSFRHRYAKNFIEAFNDISLLADLMGHESIDTTRIYLRRTSGEQQDIVDKTVTW